MNKISIAITTIICLLCISCAEQSPYHTTGVTIGINIKQVSAGIIQAEFTPNKDAFFYYGIVELADGQDRPDDSDELFMDKVLDRAYIKYMDWKYELTNKGTPYIASFADHMLSYGKTENYFIYLWPDSRYYIYAFIVDPQNIKHVGKLFATCVTTTKESTIDAFFDMTIDRDWDFVYPLNSNGELVSSFPYTINIASQKEMLDYFEGDTFEYFNKPAWYFLFNILTDTSYQDTTYATNPAGCSFGASGRRHDGSDPNVIRFIENETYYASICSADGLFLDKPQTIYKFVWKGNDTHLSFDHNKDHIGYHW